MTEFTISLAGIPICITTQYPAMVSFCQDYLTDEQTDWRISVDMDDIIFERNRSARTDRLEGRPVQPYPDPYLATLSVYRKIAEKMPYFDTFLFHGSAVCVDGQGYLFTAKSGTGKSTHAQLWRDAFGDRLITVNDDKPLIQLTAEGTFICGTPWNGKHRLGNNVRVPLKAICILTRAEKNQICPLTAAQALPMLIQQSYRPSDPVALSRLLRSVDRMTTQVGLYRLGCNMEPEAAIVAYNGMNTKET